MDLQTYLQNTETTQKELGARIGVSQGLVYQWLTGRTRITAERAIEIEKATSGQVTRKELRPEIF